MKFKKYLVVVLAFASIISAIPFSVFAGSEPACTLSVGTSMQSGVEWTTLNWTTTNAVSGSIYNMSSGTNGNLSVFGVTEDSSRSGQTFLGSTKPISYTMTVTNKAGISKTCSLVGLATITASKIGGTPSEQITVTPTEKFNIIWSWNGKETVKSYKMKVD